MATNISTATAYATGADLVAYHDVRQIGDWLDDGGSRVAANDVPGHTTVARALLRASGEVEAACLAGGRYTAEELSALTGASLELLKGLVCDLAYWYLWNRRKNAKGDEKPPLCSFQAQEMIERMRLGERIFGLELVADAGVGPEVITMTKADLDNQNLTTHQADRFFGIRANRERAR